MKNLPERFKLGIEKLNTLQRLSESYLSEEFNKRKECEKPVCDDILTVKETARYLKTTTQTIYSLVNKGKFARKHFTNHLQVYFNRNDNGRVNFNLKTI